MSLTHIETIELGSSQSSITFSSIPQDYDDLKILVSARSDEDTGVNDTSDYIEIQLNSESNEFVFLYGGGSGFSSFSVSDTRMALIPGGDATANTFGNLSIYISNYTSTSDKSISVDEVYENNGTTAEAILAAGLSTSTAATTSITFTLLTGPNFVSGSTFSLYGISAGGDGTVSTA